MFRLKATLVATTLMRPWRTGWSVDRGVDFSLEEAIRPSSAPSTERGAVAAAEPVCFIDRDQAAPPDAAMARRFDRLAEDAGGLEPPPEDGPEAASLRGWWSLTSKPSRT
ncbi:MAG: hypothetical protein Q8O54_02495 [Brevundimonas sp.]|nr:hypothetical protein [Brevundimonas sp.]